jgi:glutamate N-acetyltransferase/amino-acid N-acetyltransferase
VPFSAEKLMIQLGDFVLMDRGTPQVFDRAAASAYLKAMAADSSLPPNATAHSNDLEVHDQGQHLPLPRNAVFQRIDQPVVVTLSIGDGRGVGTAWGCDLSYDYVKINAEYTT